MENQTLRPLAEDLYDCEVVFELEYENTTLVKYDTNKLVKFGTRPSLREAETMKFVRDHTSIPVPRVYDAYTDDEGDGYIIMDYVDGVRLDACWNGLDTATKKSITSQLRGYMDELRKIPTPLSPYIGRLGYTEVDDLRSQHNLGGPFDTEEEFNSWLLSRIVEHLQGNNDRLRRYLTEAFEKQTREKRHKIVFTHADFHPRNILVRDGRVVALLDWETAGWFPEYWEFLKAMAAPMEWKTDWVDYLEQILDNYGDEYLLDCILDQYFEKDFTVW